MPGPKPTPDTHFFKDPRTWVILLAATVVVLACVIAYLLSR